MFLTNKMTLPLQTIQSKQPLLNCKTVETMRRDKKLYHYLINLFKSR